MAPKQDKAAQKAEQKKREKVAEDKTFGLKNKNRSKQVQRYVQSVTQNAKTNNDGKPKRAGDEFEDKKNKDKEAQKLAMLTSMFGNMAPIKKKEKAPAKLDVYVDQREQMGEKKETCADWDQETLEKVVKSKHGAHNSNATEIVCKYFLEAVEKNLYGWFWVCPNGGDTCKYRHALPPGFVLKKSKKPEDEEEEEEIPIEEQIEEERAALPAGGTPVTYESFMAWKKRKEDERLAAVQAEQANAKKAGKAPNVGLSGRDLFTFDPSLFVDDTGAADLNSYPAEESKEEGAGETLTKEVENADLFLDEDLPDDDELDGLEDD